MQREIEWVFLGQAGYDVAAVWGQVERILKSKFFDGLDTPPKVFSYLVGEALKGHLPQYETIAQEHGSFGETFARTNTNRVRKSLEEYYAEGPKRGEIRLKIPPQSYLVVAPRHIAGLSDVDIPASAEILEPANNAYVGARVRVRGRVDSLDPDLRLWLIVLAGDEHYYLQCRISRRSPFFDVANRPGRMELGKYEGERWSFLLVAAGYDADHAFQTSKNECKEVFGDRLPADTKVLAAVEVERRDLRPGAPTAPKPSTE